MRGLDSRIGAKRPLHQGIDRRRAKRFPPFVGHVLPASRIAGHRRRGHSRKRHPAAGGGVAGTARRLGPVEIRSHGAPGRTCRGQCQPNIATSERLIIESVPADPSRDILRQGHPEQNCECSQRIVTVARSQGHDDHSRGYPRDLRCAVPSSSTESFKRFAFGVAVLIAVAAVLATGVFRAGHRELECRAGGRSAAVGRSLAAGCRYGDIVGLAAALHPIAVVENREFPAEKRAIGSIDFNEDQARPGVHALSGPDHSGLCQSRR